MESETSKTYVFGNEGNNSVPAWLAYGNNGGWGNGFGGGNFWGAGIGGFLGSALGNWIGGNGFGMNGGGAAAAALGAQATANNNTDLLIQAISSNGEQSRQAIQTVSNMLGQDFATVSAQFGAINGILNNMAIQNATTPLQIINQICSGNKDLAATFAQCCCENKLLVTEQGYQSQLRTVEQTGAINNGFAAVNQNIAATKAAQELSDCKQSQLLVDTMNRNYQLLDNKIDALESSRKDREITALTAQVAKLESQNFTAGIVQQAVAPLNAAINGIAREVDDIKCKLPATINVEYPQVGVYNATPNMNNFGWNGGFFGNGWNNGIAF
jgi:hypothetical protein